eukprot:scaffold185862_cov13-Tisochrysis_lutea.AAC.1
MACLMVLMPACCRAGIDGMALMACLMVLMPACYRAACLLSSAPPRTPTTLHQHFLKRGTPDHSIVCKSCMLPPTLTCPTIPAPTCTTTPQKRHNW